MTNKEVSCLVLGHNTGPSCEECGKPMDSVRIETKGHKLYNRQGHYCYYCTFGAA